MSRFTRTLITSVIASSGLALSAGAMAQPPKWLADQGPLLIIGDVVVDNTNKQSTSPQGTADNFACKVHMHATALGQVPMNPNSLLFQVDHAQIMNNGGDPNFSAFCAAVTTGGFPWTGQVVEVGPDDYDVTISGIFINAPNQPGCGPNGTVTATWKQTWTLSYDQAGVGPFGSFLRSAYSMIQFPGGPKEPMTPIIDGDPNDEYCLIGGVLNVTRPTGPLVCPDSAEGICEQDDL